MDIFEVKTVELAGGYQLPDNSTTYFLPAMVDLSQALDAVFFVYSTGDQDVTVQVVGHHRDGPQESNALVNLEDAAVTLPDGSSAAQIISLPINLLELWHPYLGLSITTTTGFSSGSITAICKVREYSAAVKAALERGAVALLGQQGDLTLNPPTHELVTF